MIYFQITVSVLVALIALGGVIYARHQQTKIDLLLVKRKEMLSAYANYLGILDKAGSTLFQLRSVRASIDDEVAFKKLTQSAQDRIQRKEEILAGELVTLSEDLTSAYHEAFLICSPEIESFLFHTQEIHLALINNFHSTGDFGSSNEKPPRPLETFYFEKRECLRKRCREEMRRDEQEILSHSILPW